MFKQAIHDVVVDEKSFEDEFPIENENPYLEDNGKVVLSSSKENEINQMNFAANYLHYGKDKTFNSNDSTEKMA